MYYLQPNFNQVPADQMADERLEIVGVAQEASIQVAAQDRLPATVAQKPLLESWIRLQLPPQP